MVDLAWWYVPSHESGLWWPANLMREIAICGALLTLRGSAYVSTTSPPARLTSHPHIIDFFMRSSTHAKTSAILPSVSAHS
jgi:hypothetical protein